jgi:hypothetical protein
VLRFAYDYAQGKETRRPFIYPLITSDRSGFRSLASSAQALSKARGVLQATRAYYLYLDGVLIGTFQVTGLEDMSQQNGPVLAPVGGITWKATPSENVLALRDFLALSQQIQQPFYPRGARLGAAQSRELDSVLRDLAMRAPKIWARARGREAPAFRLGSRGQPSITVMDITRDGRPEVYARVEWSGGAPCAKTSASVFATWTGLWRVIKGSTYMSQCRDVEALGDSDFHVAAVDVDGDGVAEVLLSEGRWESWRWFLYRLEGSHLVKVLDIGRFGQ